MYLYASCVSGALQISDSQETDQGKYECVAENTVGTQHATTMQLWVRGEWHNLFCCYYFYFIFFVYVLLLYFGSDYRAYYLLYMYCVIPIRIFLTKTQLCVKTKNKLENWNRIIFHSFVVSFSFFIQRDLCTFFF